MKLSPNAVAKPKFEEIDRRQLFWTAIDPENLIPEGHAARAICALVDRLDLRAFEAGVRSWEGGAGRPGKKPQLLASVWIYGYSLGVASARALSRMMAWEPGLRWLSGLEEISYHTLSDFRVGHEEALKQLFAQVLAVLAGEGMVELRVVMQDGTKVVAQAGKGSFHGRQTIEARLAEARAYVEELDRQASREGCEPQEERLRAARRRAARERQERLEEALMELERREPQAAPQERSKLRVSVSEPEARKLKQNDGGWLPSYNVQFNTDAKEKVIVGVRVVQAAADVEQLRPGLEEVERNLGRKPECVVADGGYASRENVLEMAEQQVDLVTPWKDEAARQAGALKVNGIGEEFAGSTFRWEAEGNCFVCRAGRRLEKVGERKHHGCKREVFAARAQDCAGCEWKQACCGRSGKPRRLERVVETAAMRAYLERMQQPQTQALYQRRKEVAETPQMRMKANWKWRKFSVRGLVKAAHEAIWLALAFNVQQWTRLRWRPALAVA